MAFVSVAVELGLWDYSKTVNVIAANINFNVFCLSPPRRIQTFSTIYFLVFILMPVTLVAIFSVVFLCLLRKRLNKRRRRVGPGQASVSHSVSTQPQVTANSSSMASTSTSSDGSTESSTRQRYMKPAITLFGLVSAMVICMVPYCSYVIIVEGLCPKCDNVKVLYGVLILQYCNACLDPFFYAITQNKIRHFYRKKIKNICRL